ncbi:MAG: C1 family peptidase [Candidatus Peribacteria bacterium]|nr:C1 family peptidase [Candidatus Peribacteria bacterium]
MAPIGEMTNTGDRQHYLSGIIKNVDINKYLQHGVLKYP